MTDTKQGAMEERDKRIVELESALASIIAMCRADGLGFAHSQDALVAELVAEIAAEKAIRMLLADAVAEIMQKSYMGKFMGGVTGDIYAICARVEEAARAAIAKAGA